MPASRDNTSWIVVPGERAMSCAVITLFDAPTMPVPVRDAQTSIGGKNCVASCALAVAGSRKAKAAIALRFRIIPQVPMIPRIPMTYVPSFAPALVRGRIG